MLFRSNKRYSVALSIALRVFTPIGVIPSLVGFRLRRGSFTFRLRGGIGYRIIPIVIFTIDVVILDRVDASNNLLVSSYTTS